MTPLKLLLGLLLAASFAHSALITNLPGAPHVHFKQYSGYISTYTKGSALERRQLHYWFVESSSPTAEHDPVVLWLTGGPGCSGMLALLTENGPFNLNKDGKTLQLNPYSWNTKANIIYVEAPAGVGYSLTAGKTTNYVTNDTQTALDNSAFLRGFFSQPEFQHLAKNDFFIAGESYAGHYVPQLAQQILLGNDQGQTPKINLKGSMSGNPCTNDDMDAQSYIPFLYNHALVGITDYQNADKACASDFVHNTSPACAAAKKTIFDAMTNRINPYNIYATCEGQGAPSPGYCFTAGAGMSAPMVKVFSRQLAEAGLNRVGSQTVVPCMDMSNAHTYMNSKEVRKALHIPTAFDSDEWFVCSQVLTYTSDQNNMIPIYNFLNTRIRVLIYSGDADSCVNYLGTETAALQIQAAGKQTPWHAWEVDNQVAGYAMGLGDNVTFCTVKEAGHMVPSADIGKPANALAMFSRFIAGSWP